MDIEASSSPFQPESHPSTSRLPPESLHPSPNTNLELPTPQTTPPPSPTIDLERHTVTLPPLPEALAPPTICLEQEQMNILKAKRDLEWQKILMAFCFASALEISLRYGQISQSKYLHSYHFLSFAILLVFTCLFISQFIGKKFGSASKLLEKMAIFIAATMFFTTIAIPFPLSIKCATWSIYAISLLAIVICYCF